MTSRTPQGRHEQLALGFEVSRQERAPEPAPNPRATGEWSGAIPGQMVMGVKDLSHTDDMAVDRHGFVHDDGRSSHDPYNAARDLYTTHGGQIKVDPETRMQAFKGRLPDSEYQAHLNNLRTWSAAHTSVWDSLPVQEVRADTPVHTAQPVDYTETRQRPGHGIDQIKDSVMAGHDIHEPAWLALHKGRLYSLDGHHRITAARRAGLPSYPAKVWDFDRRGFDG